MPLRTPMYGLPLSQSDQRIRSVFQSVWNNTVSPTTELLQKILSTTKSHRCVTFSDQQTFAINMKFISVKTVIDHKISSINAKAINEKSSSTISCLICLQPKVLPFPLVYWVVNLTLTDNIVPKIYRELSALGTLDLES